MTEVVDVNEESMIEDMIGREEGCGVNGKGKGENERKK